MELTIITRKNEIDEFEVDEAKVAAIIGSLECGHSDDDPFTARGPWATECLADFDKGSLEFEGTDENGVSWWSLHVWHTFVVSGKGQDWEETETHDGPTVSLTTEQVRTFMK